MYFKKSLFLPAMLSLVVLAGCSDPAEEAEKAYDAKDYKNTLKYSQAAIKKNKPKGYLFLGRLYEFGQGVPQDYQKAVENYQKAIDLRKSKPQSHDCFLAACALAKMHLEGKVKINNLSEVIDFFKSNAEKGDVDSQSLLGMFYVMGDGTKRNYSDAAKWLKKAADKGHRNAQTTLASLYESGNGVPQNSAIAMEYYQKAAEQGEPEAQYSLGMILVDKQKYDEAFKWFKKSADQENIKAVTYLGLAYRFGKGTSPDMERALNYFEKAAEKGEVIGQYFAGIMLIKGEVVNRNSSKGLKYLTLAAEANYNDSQYLLGDLFYRGILGIKKDKKVGLEWFKKAVHNGSVPAKNTLAYYWAENNEQLKKAEQYIKDALKQSPDDCCYLDTYGWVLYKQKKYQKAAEILERAVKIEKDDPTLLDHLGDVYVALGRKQDAVKQWKLALKYVKDDKELKQKIDKKLKK